MNKYTLTASLKGQRSMLVFESHDDKSAIADGADWVMGFARNGDRQVELWARGRIILKNMGGDVLSVMEPKS